MYCWNCGTELIRPIPQNFSVSEKVVCPHCGSLVPADKRFCIQCGEPLSEENLQESSQNKTEVTVEYTVCPTCGARVPAGRKFCIECGSRLDSIEEVTENSEDIGNVAEVAEPVNEKDTAESYVICPHCGKKSPVGMLFCMECGTKLSDVSSVLEKKLPVSVEKEAEKKSTGSDSYIICPNCGNKSPAGMLFCMECGTKLNASALSEEKAEPVSIEKAEVEKNVAKMDDAEYIICPSCGKKTPAGMLYCMECGTRLNDSAIKEKSEGDLDSLEKYEAISPKQSSGIEGNGLTEELGGKYSTQRNKVDIPSTVQQSIPAEESARSGETIESEAAVKEAKEEVNEASLPAETDDYKSRIESKKHTAVVEDNGVSKEPGENSAAQTNEVDIPSAVQQSISAKEFVQSEKSIEPEVAAQEEIEAMALAEADMAKEETEKRSALFEESETELKKDSSVKDDIVPEEPDKTTVAQMNEVNASSEARKSLSEEKKGEKLTEDLFESAVKEVKEETADSNNDGNIGEEDASRVMPLADNEKSEIQRDDQVNQTNTAQTEELKVDDEKVKEEEPITTLSEGFKPVAQTKNEEISSVVSEGEAKVKTGKMETLKSLEEIAEPIPVEEAKDVSKGEKTESLSVDKEVSQNKTAAKVETEEIRIPLDTVENTVVIKEERKKNEKRTGPYMICPSCGKINRKGLSFCTQCGASLKLETEEKKDTAEYIVCPHCGKMTRADKPFCFECGSKLTIECPECGLVMPYNMKFCARCGALLHKNEK